MTKKKFLAKWKPINIDKFNKANKKLKQDLEIINSWEERNGDCVQDYFGQINDLKIMKNFNLGQKIKQLRIMFGYTQEEFCKKLDINRVSLSNLELGQRGLSAEELLFVCDIFGQNMRNFMVMDLQGLLNSYEENKISIEEQKHYLQ